ncbi:Growth-regulating factor 10 [Linum perenne]
MDEESPWRCRRTDGKKWRCKRNVVPDHKYCDRHINRGRLRSRKPVEQQQQQQPLPHFHPADHPQTKNDGGGGCSKVSVRVGGVAVSSTTAAPSLATTAAAHSRVEVSHHFSPKSVLPEEELRRCRRTDGKKWRCRREVVYNQKYCDRHLHRGAKRRPEVAATSGGVPPFLHCSNLLPRKASCILTQAAVAPDDDNVCNSSTSSDATVSEGRLYN